MLRTPDGRYLVVRGRLWRTSDPALDEDERDRLVRELMQARRAVQQANKDGSDAALKAARAAVDAAKHALGERGPVWWDDGAPDYTRHLARTTPYAEWWAGDATGRGLTRLPGPGWQDGHHHVRRCSGSPRTSATTRTGVPQRRHGRPARPATQCCSPRRVLPVVICCAPGTVAECFSARAPRVSSASTSTSPTGVHGLWPRRKHSSLAQRLPKPATTR